EAVKDYCKLGWCTSFLCGSLTTLQNSGKANFLSSSIEN
ncbi:unnamed protein product, partial [Brassica oleracea var. botrytis]